MAYGWSIRSALPLPELMAVEAAFTENEADVVIRLGKIATAPFATNGAARRLQATAGGIYLFWQGVGLFLVHGGREMVIDPAPGVTEDTLRLFILSTPLALLLQQRGLAVLHASTAVIAGQAIAFAGEKGAGKSIMAAALHARGHELLADDILAINMLPECPLALPGFPYLKLWPDAVAALGYAPEMWPRLHPQAEKRGCRLTARFATASVPLKSIYLLKQGQELKIEPLCPREALLELLPHWYGARFGPELLQELGLSTHFLQCATLVNKINVYRLERPDCLAGLADAARLVEAHAAADLQPVSS